MCQDGDSFLYQDLDFGITDLPQLYTQLSLKLTTLFNLWSFSSLPILDIQASF